MAHHSCHTSPHWPASARCMQTHHNRSPGHSNSLKQSETMDQQSINGRSNVKTKRNFAGRWSTTGARHEPTGARHHAEWKQVKTHHNRSPGNSNQLKQSETMDDGNHQLNKNKASPEMLRNRCPTSTHWPASSRCVQKQLNIIPQTTQTSCNNQRPWNLLYPSMDQIKIWKSNNMAGSCSTTFATHHDAWERIPINPQATQTAWNNPKPWNSVTNLQQSNLEENKGSPEDGPQQLPHITSLVRAITLHAIIPMRAKTIEHHSPGHSNLLK